MAASLLKKKKSSRQKQQTTTATTLKRIALFGMLLVAWTWIMVTFGMVFYHGYYKKNKKTTTAAAAAINHPSPLSQQQQQQQPKAAAGDQQPPEAAGGGRPLQPYESPLLIFTCNRDTYLKETLEDVLKYVPNDCSMGCPVIVSQDGNKAEVAQVVAEYAEKFKQVGVPVVHLQHSSALRGGRNAYQALAVHYGWALGQVFDDNGVGVVEKQWPAGVVPQRVVILEEDLHVASDFFRYFRATAPLLDNDPTLYAVSSFNDNGYESRVDAHRDAARVLRSDFFPGLGWMMTRKLWTDELRAKWPKGYWDDWLRDPSQRRGRQVLRPEISRTFHFGTVGGASGNQFGGQLSRVLLNPTPVDWSGQDLSYLSPNDYDRTYWDVIQAARHVGTLQDAQQKCRDGNVRLEYASTKEFQELARGLGLMDDEKAGVFRTAYRGVVETRPHGEHLLLLTPPLRELQKEFDHVL